MKNFIFFVLLNVTIYNIHAMEERKPSVTKPHETNSSQLPGNSFIDEAKKMEANENPFTQSNRNFESNPVVLKAALSSTLLQRRNKNKENANPNSQNQPNQTSS